MQAARSSPNHLFQTVFLKSTLQELWTVTLVAGRIDVLVLVASRIRGRH